MTSALDLSAQSPPQQRHVHSDLGHTSKCLTEMILTFRTKQPTIVCLKKLLRPTSLSS
ncbi:Hypothetical predicted protein, partial [Pelobates cultripes]